MKANRLNNVLIVEDFHRCQAFLFEQKSKAEKKQNLRKRPLCNMRYNEAEIRLRESGILCYSIYSAGSIMNL